MTSEYGLSEDPLHRATYPDRRCVVATVACKGDVCPYGPAMMCDFHRMKWSDDDHNARHDRMREWVRAERVRDSGKVVAVEPRGGGR